MLWETLLSLAKIKVDDTTDLLSSANPIILWQRTIILVRHDLTFANPCWWFPVTTFSFICPEMTFRWAYVWTYCGSRLTNNESRLDCDAFFPSDPSHLVTVHNPFPALLFWMPSCPSVGDLSACWSRDGAPASWECGDEWVGTSCDPGEQAC